MIKSIRLKNFFSFEEQTVRLNPDVNLLVGINGSGKSNFIKAFELLRFGINEGPVHQLINEKWGGFSKTINFLNREDNFIELDFLVDAKQFLKNGTEAKNITYEINVRHDWGVIALKQRVYLGDNEIPDTLEMKEVEKDDAKFREVAEYHLDEGDYKAYKERKEHINLLSEEAIVKNRKIGLFKHYIKQTEVYKHIDITHKGVKKPNEMSDKHSRLSSAFDNLTGLLQLMSVKSGTEEYFDKIQSLISKINVNLGGVEFDYDDGKLILKIKEKRNNYLLDSNNVSDGTLKFLTLMSILYNPNRGNIVCIEEPEDGLHPDMINTVAEGIKYAAETSQMIISTHSPFLLNAFKLEDILVFENDKNNNTVVTELSQKDFSEWKDDFTAGQAWLNGLIGGTRW